MSTVEVALTTFDNPYDPFNKYDDWKSYDEDILGYNTCCYLARIANTSSAMSDEDNEIEIERAIDEIVSLNSHLYVKVFNKKN